MSIAYRQHKEMGWQTVLDGFAAQPDTCHTIYLRFLAKCQNALRHVNALNCSVAFLSRRVFLGREWSWTRRWRRRRHRRQSLHLLAYPVLPFSVFSTQPLRLFTWCHTSGSAYFPWTKISTLIVTVWWWCQSARSCMRHFSIVLRWHHRRKLVATQYYTINSFVDSNFK